MKTTINLPDEILRLAEVVVARHRPTPKDLVVTDLDSALRFDADSPAPQAALARRQKGLRLGGQPLTRAQTHERP